MKYSLKIEAIGDDQYQYMRLWTNILNMGVPGLGDLLGTPKPNYWVALITGFDNKFNYSRQFLKPKKDYAKSNNKGSRGVYFYYILESGYIYQVSSPITWKRTEKYFCIVSDDGEIQRVEKDFVDQWIKDHSALVLIRPQNNE